MSTLVALFHNRWSVPILAELHRQRGSRFVTLSRTLGLSRESLRRTLAAIRYLESTVTRSFEVEGIVLRYGAFYGEDTGLLDGPFVDQVRRRRRDVEMDQEVVEAGRGQVVPKGFERHPPVAARELELLERQRTVGRRP